MTFTTKGIVIEEIKTVEANRLLTLYTEKKGVIRAIAKRAKGIKNPLFSGITLFQYSEFILTQNRSSLFTIEEAGALRSFFSISASVEGVALALYCAELVKAIHPDPVEAGEHLPFMLNTLHLIGEQKKDLDILKAIFELRTMSCHGFMPSLIACADCCIFKQGPHFFDYSSGKIFCFQCSLKLNVICNLSAAAVAAMRHIVFSNAKEVFFFDIKEKSIGELFSLIEKYTIWHSEHKIKSLDFYKQLKQEQ